MPPKKNQPDLESSMKELEALITQMEKKDLPLEESLAHFEKGVSLVTACQKTLQATELKVQQLIEQNDQLSLQDLKPNDDS
jgi:exodeoxyribonuclease VII small subunit